ncbi:MAG: NAD(P)H oxidoreductase [Bacteroidetes bacterium]|jgi:glutathione-regulated potassium-efflux system ancillary protein KefG|nr:MAG: NAD(P)H oxidoreductase [Bacteroidota bacterium]
MVPKKRILILFFHPLAHKSRVNRVLINSVKEMEGITIKNMYDLYPDFHIDVKAEQRDLLNHDLIIWQHPFYWYSSPSLLKEWIDLVLVHGFAYGREGKALAGKQIMTAITTGGRNEAYIPEDGKRYSVPQLLAPFEQTVHLCRMNYLPPFVVHGTHLLEERDILEAGSNYRKVIQMLRDESLSEEEIRKENYINHIIL